jgi:DNA polymerase III epsilon subunit-like protein
MFKKDILLIDIEATGTDVTKHEIIQLAGLLLDGKTLREKKRFESFVQPKRWQTRDPEAMAVTSIRWDQVKNAPSLKAVLQKFNRTFGDKAIIGTYGGGLDITFFPAAYRQNKMRYPFDYHEFNLWPIFYVYMARRNKLTNKNRFAGFSMEDMMKHFKIAVPAGRHTALVDCEIEAELLRRVLKELKK